MPNSTLLPKLIFVLATLLAIGLGLTTYTNPIVGRIHDADLIAVLGPALGDARPVLPGLPPQLTVHGVESPTQVPGLEVGSRHDSTSAASGPLAWAERAAAADSAGLRGWLTQPVFASAELQGNSVHVTRRRFTLHAGCPLISHLWSVETRPAGRLVDLSSDCPRITVAGATSLTH